LNLRTIFAKTAENPGHTDQDRLLSILRLISLALVLAMVACVRIRLLDIPLERDEGEYAYLGQLLLKGSTPFLHAYTMKLPGAGIAYALIMFLFGETVRGIHLGHLAVNGVNALLVFLLARRLLGNDAAPVSCAAYAVLSLSATVLGVFAHATHFVVLFALLSSIAMLRWQESRKAMLLFMSGMLLGLAVIMKQHAAILVVFAVLYLATDVMGPDTRPARSRLGACALFLLGAFIPYALIALWMAAAGVFGTFWFWTVTYAGSYASAPTFADGWQAFVRKIDVVMLGPQLPLWLLAGMGGIVLCTPSGRRTDRAFLYGLAVFSFLAACPGFYFRKHYFVMVLPAVALLAGFAVAASERAISAAARGNALRFVPLGIFLAAVGYGVYHERDYLFSESPFAVSRSIYGINPFPEAQQIARYLREHTSAHDTIAVVGSEPEIYFYAGRPAATSYIYMYSLMEKQPYAESMQVEMIRQIEKARPAYIVMVNTPASWLETQDSSETILRWVAEYVAAGYEPAGMIDILSYTETVYLWGAEAAGHAPESVSSVILYKRKN